MFSYYSGITVAISLVIYRENRKLHTVLFIVCCYIEYFTTT